MKILASENEICPLTILEKEILLSEQSKALNDLYLSNHIREIYQKTNSNLVVIILECISLREAERHLVKLPLVRAGKSKFSIEILEPYQGCMSIIK